MSVPVADEALLVVRGLHKRFGSTAALAGVDLVVRAGEVHALVGENGAGKSTLLKALAGVHAPDAGTIELGGVPFAPAGPAAARRAGLAVIHQELALVPHLTIAENLTLGREPRVGPFVARARQRESARHALAEVGRAHLDPDTPVAALAPADRQLVEIARALAQDCRLLILDEPTSSLARGDVAPLLARLRALAARGVAVVCVSHVFEELFAVADRFTVLRDGASVASGAMAAIDHDGLVAAMVGRSVTELYPRSPAPPGEVVLEVAGLCGRRAPHDANLQVRRGEVFGLAGLVGAGRTELLRAIFGLDSVRQGRVRVATFAGPLEPAAAWRAGLGMVSEDRKGEGLMLGRPIAENLWLPALRQRAQHGWLAAAALAQASLPHLERFAVRCAGPQQPVGELSGGNQQKVALARLLAAAADVLLLDEPTRGVDIGAKAEIYAAIDELAHRRGKAVLVVSSYLPELLGIADRIAVVHRGTVSAPRPSADWCEATLLAAMTSGRTA